VVLIQHGLGQACVLMEVPVILCRSNMYSPVALCAAAGGVFICRLAGGHVGWPGLCVALFWADSLH
jgi:hypothetical protein